MSTQAEDRKAQLFWDDYLRNLLRAAVVDMTETQEEKMRRIADLERPGNEEEWFRYYHPNYYKAECAPFHRKSTRWVMQNMEGYLVRAWSREMSKDVRTMMETTKLALTKKKKLGILISSSAEKAALLLKPYKINFESNPRIINDYGDQITYGAWTESAFSCKCGMTWIAIGKGQTPRGLRNEDVRPDLVVVTDMDTDEDCRNPEMIAKDWAWFEKAVYGTRSVSEPFLVIFLGNIIAEDCTINNAIKKADRAEVINLEDEEGNSNWPEKNTLEMIARIKSKISYAAYQGEYMNNPITDGKTFPGIYFKRMQPLKNYRFLVSYCDPSYKSGKKNDFKAVVLMGKYQHEYHVLKVRCAQTTTAQMLKWHYEMLDFVNGAVPLYMLIEWPWIDEPLQLEIQKYNANNTRALPLVPDERKKPDKYFRIESSLQPVNFNAQLFFNEQEKGTQHMIDMEAQFKAFGPTSRAHDDGPDAVEGGKFVIDSKIVSNAEMQTVPRYENPKRV